jgi:hypothetical protein
VPGYVNSFLKIHIFTDVAGANYFLVMESFQEFCANSERFSFAFGWET